MSQPLVLAIEPDLRQAAIVKRIVREKALADVVVVDSRDAAIETMRTSMPDVLLLSALLSPRDEDELMAHLRTLDNAAHLQTHTIPQLASSLGPGEERGGGGLFSAFRRKSKADTAPVAGCDPDLFADEIRVYLQRAADRKRLLQTESFVAPDMRPRAAAAAAPDTAAEHDDTAGATESSSWASPFEWKPSTSRKSRARTEAPAAPVAPLHPPASAPPPGPAPEPVTAAPIVDAPSVIKPVEDPIFTPTVVAQPAPPVVEPAPAAVARAVVDQPLIPPPAVTQPADTRPLVAERVGTLVEPAPKKVAKTAETLRPKPVADRPARLTGGQLRDLLRKQAASERAGDGDRLGPVARWARTDAPRAARSATVTGEDVRALISSLAVPQAIASVTYPSGCRIRRVRVPASPEQPAA